MRPLLALAILALLSALALARTSPPSAKPIDADATEFSASRAARTLADMAGDGVPHPAGSAAHDRVREILATRLAALGLEVTRPSAFVCGRTTCATVTDLLARIPGRVGANAVLLTAHYDSVSAGPGASDDGMGVATVLEVARALAAGAPTRRPVWLLLTDGEELGLLGAKAFVADASLAGQVGVVVNVEARGTSGPSLMFETSPHNAALVRAFATSTTHPVTSSLFPTLYAMLPNDTDLSVYKAAGIAGLNYAIIGGAARYHTPADDVVHADLRSLQHHGNNALAIVRTLAAGATTLTATDDAVFFDVLGAFVVRWPARAASHVALVVLAAVALAVATALRRRLLTARAFALGLVPALGLPAAAVAGIGVTATYRALGSAPAAWVAHPTALIVACCAAGAFVMLVFSAVLAFVAAGATPCGSWSGIATSFAIGGFAVALAAPTLSFLLVVPAAGGALGLLAWLLHARGATERLQAWALVLPAATVIVWVPPLGLIYDALGTFYLAGLSFGSGLLVWSAGTAVAGLNPTLRRGLRVASAVVLALSLPGSKLPRAFDADTPQHVSLRAYVAGGEPARTFLFAPDGAPSTVLDLLPEHAAAWPWSQEQPTASSAPGPGAPPAYPIVDVVSPENARDGAGPEAQREIVLRIRSARGASTVGIAIRPGDVEAVRIHGVPLSPPGPMLHRAGPWPAYECVTVKEEGIDVALTATNNHQVVAYVFDRSAGLPAGAPAQLAGARGANAAPYGAGDYTIVARRLEL